MGLPFRKKHHKKYLLQSAGFVVLVLFTAITVMVGNSVYRYASLLQQQNESVKEVDYAIFHTEEISVEKSSPLSALLTFIK